MEHEKPDTKQNNHNNNLNRVDSDTELVSLSSDYNSPLLTPEDSRTSSSSSSMSSSGEIPAGEEIIPRSLTVAPSPEEEEEDVAVREKCVGRKNNRVSWGMTSVIGRRKEMEDAVAVMPAFMSSSCDHVGGCTATGSMSSSEISPVHFFGVFDGHGGSQVAKFCAERMHEVIAEEWGRETMDGHEWQRRWETVFTSGFERTDNEIHTETVETEMIGSTAVVAVLSSCQIITSNCGDSRAVLCRGTQTIPLTIDQKPDREDELMRIEREGGKVINWNGARVFGVLAMSRALGDRYLRPWIIPLPEVTFTTRSEEDECLILASDGLWDVMTIEEVGEVARCILRRRRRSLATDETSPAQAVADVLTEMAQGRNSSDNISIVVVDFKAKRKRQQRQ